MKTNNRNRKIIQLTLLALLTAILVVLSLVNIPQPAGLSITFNMIPVAIAAIAMGLPGGAIIGGALGPALLFPRVGGRIGGAGLSLPEQKER